MLTTIVVLCATWWHCCPQDHQKAQNWLQPPEQSFTETTKPLSVHCLVSSRSDGRVERSAAIWDLFTVNITGAVALIESESTELCSRVGGKTSRILCGRPKAAQFVYLLLNSDMTENVLWHLTEQEREHGCFGSVHVQSNSGQNSYRGSFWRVDF